MAKNRVPPLNTIRDFDAAARLGSYVAAAEELHVTQPAIGRHVKNLEDWLGVKLFERTARGVTLTSEGKTYAKAVTQALHLLAKASAQVSTKPSRLRILCSPAFASRWLTPKIKQLRELRSDLKIAIEPESSFTKVDVERADLGIAFDTADRLTGVKEMLLRPAIFPVCSPEFRAQLKHDPSPEDLLGYPLIHVDDGGWWNDWFAAQEIKTNISAEISHLSNDIALNLASAGQGIALATDVLIQAQIANGTLVRCAKQQVYLDSFYILTPTPEVSDDVAWFIDWLMTTLHT